MSEPLDDEAEVIDGLPVLGDAPDGVERSRASSQALAIRFAGPAKAIAAAVGGFLAGIAVVGLVGRRNGRRGGAVLARGRGGALLARHARMPGAKRAERRQRSVAGELVQVVASRSLLVDVHLLGTPSDKR